MKMDAKAFFASKFNWTFSNALNVLKKFEILFKYFKLSRIRASRIKSFHN